MPAAAMLALVTDAFGGRGGIAQYNRDFLGALHECGAVSALAVLPRRAPDPASPPPGLVQADAHPSRLGYVLAVLWAAFARPVDMVFCGHVHLAPLAALVARLKGAKLMLQMHGIEAWSRPPRLHRAACEAADLILCVSRHTRAAVLGWAAIPPERAVVVPVTVQDAFTPGDGAHLRARWGLAGRRVLLTVGRMDERERYKGHDRVIRALPPLLAAGHDVVYVIAGEGGDRARLEALAREIGVADRVRFVGPVPAHDLPDAYRMADVFVMPSTGEGFGIAFLEAMACGTPALGLATAGAKDALADGELGVLSSEPGLAAALDRLLGAPRPARAALSAAVRARFGREAFAAAVARAMARLQGAVQAVPLPHSGQGAE